MRLEQNGVPYAQLTAEECSLRFTLETVLCAEGRTTLTFMLEAPRYASLLVLHWDECVVRLYADGVLVDEEWPIGILPSGEYTAFRADAVKSLSMANGCAPVADTGPKSIAPMQFFRPDGGNARVGDCMPFAYQGAYHL